VCAAAPIVADGVVVGALAATGSSPDPVVMRTVRQVAAVLAAPLAHDCAHEGARDAQRNDLQAAHAAAAGDGAAGGDRGYPVDQAEDLAGILPVGAPGRTRFITREQVRWVEADGDYVRLHTAEGETFLARVPISRLERSWSPHGFIRIHRGYLVPFRHISEFSVASGTHSVVVDGQHLPVSRRRAREVRSRILRARRLR
jgi:DNA-binding LytR/AlgR family response regulator